MATSPSINVPVWTYRCKNGKVLSRYAAGTDLPTESGIDLIYSTELVQMGDNAPVNNGLAELVSRDFYGKDIRVLEEIFDWAKTAGFVPSVYSQARMDLRASLRQ